MLRRVPDCISALSCSLPSFIHLVLSHPFAPCWRMISFWIPPPFTFFHPFLPPLSLPPLCRPDQSGMTVVTATPTVPGRYDLCLDVTTIAFRTLKVRASVVCAFVCVLWKRGKREGRGLGQGDNRSVYVCVCARVCVRLQCSSCLSHVHPRFQPPHPLARIRCRT